LSSLGKGQHAAHHDCRHATRMKHCHNHRRCSQNGHLGCSSVLDMPHRTASYLRNWSETGLGPRFIKLVGGCTELIFELQSLGSILRQDQATMLPLVAMTMQTIATRLRCQWSATLQRLHQHLRPSFPSFHLYARASVSPPSHQTSAKKAGKSHGKPDKNTHVISEQRRAG
jgi:hypothetical protein